MGGVTDKETALGRILEGMGSVVVAFSGGVDSAYLAVAAHRALGARSLAVTADSESLAEAQRAQAMDLAVRFGFPHRVVHTSEFLNPLYLRNESGSLLSLQDGALPDLVPWPPGRASRTSPTG
jgi:uncharacterized protein